jgi:hypothetical protein
MALFFKPFRGVRALLDAQELHDGYVHFCTDDGSFHIDFADADGNLQRKQISAKDAETLTGMTLEEIKAYVTVQSNWEQNDPDQPDYVKGRTHWEDENGEIHKLDKKFLPDDMSFTQVQADWDQSDSTAPDYVKGRTHYSEFELTEFCPETTVTTGDLGMGLPAAILPISVPLVEGFTYDIMWNGTQYSCVAFNYSNNLVVVGNKQWLDSTDENTGEPFIMSFSEEASAFGVMTSEPMTVTISIVERTETVHKIPEKYVPATPLFIDVEVGGADAVNSYVAFYRDSFSKLNRAYEEKRPIYAVLGDAGEAGDDVISLDIIGTIIPLVQKLSAEDIGAVVYLFETMKDKQLLRLHLLYVPEFGNHGSISVETMNDIIEIPQSDLAQNDPTQPDYVKGKETMVSDWNAFEGEAGYVKNRTHYIAEIAELESETIQFLGQYPNYGVQVQIDDCEYIVKESSRNYSITFPSDVYISVFVEGTKYAVNISEINGTTNRNAAVITIGQHNGANVKFWLRIYMTNAYLSSWVVGAVTEENAPAMRIEYGHIGTVPLDEIYIPNNIPKVQAATVGQTVVVKTVDENGKPTEWEASDFSSTQVQPDWLQADDSEADYIKNKPSPVDYNIEQDLTDEQKGLARANIGISGLITEDTILDLLGEVNAIAPLADDDGALLVDGDEILLL